MECNYLASSCCVLGSRLVTRNRLCCNWMDLLIVIDFFSPQHLNLSHLASVTLMTTTLACLYFVLRVLDWLIASEQLSVENEFQRVIPHHSRDMIASCEMWYRRKWCNVASLFFFFHPQRSLLHCISNYIWFVRMQRKLQRKNWLQEKNSDSAMPRPFVRDKNALADSQALIFCKK